jgi:type I restriction enzyme, S subunit
VHAKSDEQVIAVEISLRQCYGQRQNIIKTAFSGLLVAQNPNDEPASKLLERIRSERHSTVGTVGKLKSGKQATESTTQVSSTRS